MIRDEPDIAWKEILDIYFKDFLDYCLPKLSELINWERKWLSLDKELQAITKGAEAGKRLLDKLFKVYLKNGKEQWILIHIEVQGRKEDDFPKRMFIYGYRIYDKYQQPVVSCAILTDEYKNWHPRSYKVGLQGSYLSAEYLVIKLIDYRNRLLELEESNNPFASVILVQLAALDSKRKPDEYRKQLKFALTRRLYDKGFCKTAVINLYRFIDYLISLSEPLELEYLNEIHEIEEAKQMPYISTAERLGIEKGLKDGIKEGIKEGIKKEKHVVAMRMLSKGEKPVYIKEITGLSLTAIKALQAKTH